jgi:hypothetical protein
LAAAGSPGCLRARFLNGQWLTDSLGGRDRQRDIFSTTSSTGRPFFVEAKRATLRLPRNNLGDLAFVF